MNKLLAVCLVMMLALSQGAQIKNKLFSQVSVKNGLTQFGAVADATASAEATAQGSVNVDSSATASVEGEASTTIDSASQAQGDASSSMATDAAADAQSSVEGQVDAASDAAASTQN